MSEHYKTSDTWKGLRKRQLHWMEDNTRMLTINLKKLIQTPELQPRKTKYAVSLRKAASLPPRSCAVVDVNINTNSKEKVKMIPDELCQFNNPNMYMYRLHADLAEKRKDTLGGSNVG